MRGAYRPLSVDEPPGNPREDVDPEPPILTTHIVGLPQENLTTATQTSPTFSGAMDSQTSPSLSGASMPTPDFRPPGPAVRTPPHVRPNSSLGQLYHTDGTITFSSRRGRSLARKRSARSLDSSPPPTSPPATSPPATSSRWVSPPLYLTAPPVPIRLLLEVQGHLPLLRPLSHSQYHLSPRSLHQRHYKQSAPRSLHHHHHNQPTPRSLNYRHHPHHCHQCFRHLLRHRLRCCQLRIGQHHHPPPP